MELNTDLVGAAFEEYFYNHFPGFINTTADKRVPDFYNPEHQFWVEAKAGNRRWGPRIHEYQLAQSRELRENTVYALGFHDFDQLNERLGAKPDRIKKRILRDKMHFPAIIFVNLGLVSSVWDKDSRTSKEKGEQYLMFKQSVVRNITLGRPFKRFDEPVDSASNYYDFDYSEFLMASPSFSGTAPQIGTILHKEQDRNVITYLEKRGLIV